MKIVALQIQFQMSSSAGSEEQFYEMEYVEDPNRPKRPYLKRKSVMMAPQKLDWSKVSITGDCRIRTWIEERKVHVQHPSCAGQTYGPLKA